VLAAVRTELRKPGRGWALLIILWIVVAVFGSWIVALIWVGGTAMLWLISALLRRHRSS